MAATYANKAKESRRKHGKRGAFRKSQSLLGKMLFFIIVVKDLINADTAVDGI